MEDRSRTKRRSHKRKKKSVGRIVFFIFSIIFMFLTTIGSYFVWQAYRDVRTTTDEMYEEVEAQEQHSSRQDRPVVVDDGEDPFSVLIMGVDTGEYGRIETGRTDTMMVLTVNPNTNQTSIVSIPRDTYTEIIGRGEKDKINHAYAFGGTAMAVNTVQNLFDIPIDYYVSVNMESMQQIVDAVGGITVVPPITFSQAGYQFNEGQPVSMGGAQALEYSRMRYNDPDGDYGRQHRQRQVIEGTMSSIASFDSLRNYRSILESLSTNMKTNMSFDDMFDMFNNYRGSVSNVEQLQLSGHGQMQNGVYYEMIPDEELTRVREHLNGELELN
ncbi:LCP family protein required for cell wall assembly [Alkalibacterium olivapovliticus]|uniref:LCP family protein required for cell wall assembly n=1 Tax=Alkalibacterium olivapovliticus TaxID=99907 RepID=A0A2T0W7N3_9LACT|nr:LCP family protein required for cell wall assembly [Alkalibacterium olivapovliticus]